jgi:L-lactate utilization protein LutB
MGSRDDILEARGIEVVDTDLGERIVQLAKEPLSHIVMPVIRVTARARRRAKERHESP